jgi:hypothetical protein
VYSAEPNFKEKIQEIRQTKYQYHLNFYIQRDSVFYWVLFDNSEPELLKFYGNLDDLKDIRENNPVDRRVGYYYLHYDSSEHRVISISDYEALQAILFHFNSSTKKVTIGHDDLLQLKNDLFLYKDKMFPDSCKLYAGLEDFKFDVQTKCINVSIDYAEILKVYENIKILEEKLNLKIDMGEMNREDLIAVGSACFDFVQRGDLQSLYLQLCSVYLQFLLTNNYGEQKVVNGEVYVVKGSRKIDVLHSVSRTVENLINYEYNPHLYFRVIED